MKADLNPRGPRCRAPVRTHRVLEGVGVEFGDRRERLFLERCATHALDGKRSQFPVRRHERPQVEPSLCMHQPMRVDNVVLLTPARHRVVVHGDHTLMEDGFEQSGDHVVGGYVMPLRASRVGGDHTRQSIQKLLHPRRERRLELVERALDVGQQVRSGEALDQRAAEVQGAQLGKRQAAARQRPERLRLDPPELGPIDRLVVDREPRLLERGEVAPDRAGAHTEVGRKLRNRAIADARHLLQQRPLADQLFVSVHGGRISLARKVIRHLFAGA